MVSVNTAYSTTSYASLANTIAAGSSHKTSAAPAATGNADSAATNVTLSSAAMAALAVKDFAELVVDARAKLTELLTEAERTSPLEDGKLALDMTTLDQRELFAIASNSDELFTEDEQEAAGLEMQRRFDAALAGPAAIARVTGNYTGLYKAATEHLDSLGDEEKAEPEWIAARAALTEGLKQLQADPKKLPDAGEHDPVAIYLALEEAGENGGPRPIADVAGDVRKTLDKLYAEAIANDKVPTFNKNTRIGTYIDMSTFDSRSLSAIVLDGGTEFTTEEVNAAQGALRTKSGAALMAGFQNASKSSDPTAFSQNIIGIYASMSPEERQAAGWSEQFYQAAVDSYATTSKLTQMFAEATGGATTGFMSWFGK